MSDLPMRLYVTVKYFVIHWAEISKYLVLERSTHRIYTVDSFSFDSEGIPDSKIYFIDIFLMLGVIPIGSSFYISVVTQADIKGSLKGSHIYEIREIELIEFTRSENQKTQESEKTSIKKLFSSGFYFSFSYLLTQKTCYQKKNNFLHEDSDKRFYWNLGLYKEFIAQGIEPIWFIPIIQGFFSVYHDAHAVLSLISRRSCDRTGTRYNCRGIDDMGNVANFVETEQILIINEVTFSYLQIRGSVPIFWEQTGVTAQLYITRSHELSVSAFQKHIDQLLDLYSHVTMVNLLSGSKSYEQDLTAEWKKAFDKLYPAYKDRLVYIYFDFHENCKGQKFHKVNLLLEQLSLFIDYYGFYSSQGKAQHGVVRTNCLDCLDRTNVVQSKLAWEVLLRQLRSVNQDYLMTQNSNFVKSFKLQWADNGDYLSLQYTGTGSTISSVTRTDTQGFKALIKQGLTSIERFYNANIEDTVKQISIDSVLRKRNPSQIVNKVQEELERRQNEYCKTVEFKIRIVTWNLENNTLSHFAELTDCSENCQIVIFAFQQVSEFFQFEDCLGSSMLGYAKLKTIESASFSFTVFIEKSLIDDVTLFDFDSFSLPHKGKTSSKQCSAVSFSLYDTSFCFISCHLASGTDNSLTRREQINFIQSQPFTSQSFDGKFLFGDLNFRVDLGSYQIIQSVKLKNYQDILKSEQLTHNLKFGYLPELKEANIHYPPTFPYLQGEDEYDRSRKGPCWRGRILYEGKISPIIYVDLPIKSGSHRPVEGIFLVKGKQVDREMKNEIERNIYEQLSPVPLGALPKNMACVKNLRA